MASRFMPPEGATGAHVGAVSDDVVSIHAPREGATYSDPSRRWVYMSFNTRPPVKGTTGVDRWIPAQATVSNHAPVSGRRCRRRRRGLGL